MRYLNGKLMEVKMKYGWTATAFAQYFACTEEEFLQSLHKTFDSKAYKDMVARLEKNSKRRRRAIKCVKRKHFKLSDSKEVLPQKIFNNVTIKKYPRSSMNFLDIFYNHLSIKLTC